MMNGYEKMQKVIEMLGEDTTLNEIICMMSYDELDYYADEISGMYDIELNDEDEEDF